MKHATKTMKINNNNNKKRTKANDDRNYGIRILKNVSQLTVTSVQFQNNVLHADLDLIRKDFLKTKVPMQQ